MGRVERGKVLEHLKKNDEAPHKAPLRGREMKKAVIDVLSKSASVLYLRG